MSYSRMTESKKQQAYDPEFFGRSDIYLER